MPSPFPGMDPYIESQKWRDFHGRFASDLADALMPLVSPRFLVEYDQHIFVTYDESPDSRSIYPDVTVTAARDSGSELPVEGASVATMAPIRVVLPSPIEHRQAYLQVRDAVTLDVVTIIELLSPDNKGAGGDGRGRYLEKRDEVLRSETNLVEIDLLRGGRRMPTLDPLPPCDYCVIVSRSTSRPAADAYCWTLHDPMRPIPVPLRGDAPDVILDLQQLFAARYSRSGYGASLRYDQPLRPPLRPRDVEWAVDLLKSRK